MAPVASSGERPTVAAATDGPDATTDDPDDPTPVTGPPAGTPEPALVPGTAQKRRTPFGRAKVPTNRT
jgi:hypothetical protein